MEVLCRREGFWYSQKSPMLPKPMSLKYRWNGLEEFVEALFNLQMNSGTMRLHAKGWSWCRICRAENGVATYRSHGWEWPDGFIHYVTEHNVRPSLAFQEFVLGRYL